jgi:hypothetical protein
MIVAVGGKIKRIRKNFKVGNGFKVEGQKSLSWK